LSGHAAAGQVKRARLCRQLAELAAAAAGGDVSAEHLDRVERLSERVGIDRVAEVETVLVEAARRLDPFDLGRVCGRVLVHADPDGAQPDAGRDFARRGITLSPFDGMVLVRGQLDPEGGAALTAALDALMGAPGPDELRIPAQRRADALVELARGVPREGAAPAVGGARPQVALLLTPENLVDRGSPEPAHLEWVGDVPDPVAQRIACDADVWRVITDPANGRPLDVGRAYRLVPHWLRKALYARDRGCRFPGCHAPAAWTDAHHIRSWAAGGLTDLDNLVLLCRFHHGLVHEAGWSIRYDLWTGAVTVTRPDGRPYEITARAPTVVDGAA
jgi:hypothetical protein